MSFLIRRNLPLAWADWEDTFDRPVENPVKQPWVHLGDGTTADINSLQELHIPSNYLTVDGGGESYQWQPFTRNWGVEFEIWYPVEGLAAQGFACYFTDSWSRIGAAFQNMVGVRLQHAPAAGGDKIELNQWDSMMSINGTVSWWTSPVGFNGSSLTLRIWVENDEWFRIWMNGTYVGSCTISNPTYILGPDRRCVRFLNSALCDVWMRWISHYDRTPSLPSKNVWASVVAADNFNRANGAPANGWTQIGSNSGIVSNSWASTGTTNGGRGLIRNTGVTSGRVRVEATIGGAVGPNSSSDCGLVICSNSTGTAGLCANVYAGSLYTSRFASALSDDPPTIYDFESRTTGISVTSGDVIAFSIYDGVGWIEVNGVPKLYAYDIHRVVSQANSWAGLRVRRTSGTDSASWNDVTIYQGI